MNWERAIGMSRISMHNDIIGVAKSGTQQMCTYLCTVDILCPSRQRNRLSFVIGSPRHGNERPLKWVDDINLYK